ncbi:hypothetical protein O9993_12835 [Vibrio lentus]|nr:hypothetical protein [Vibrio lentus]
MVRDDGISQVFTHDGAAILGFIGENEPEEHQDRAVSASLRIPHTTRQMFRLLAAVSLHRHQRKSYPEHNGPGKILAAKRITTPTYPQPDKAYMDEQGVPNPALAEQQARRRLASPAATPSPGLFLQVRRQLQITALARSHFHPATLIQRCRNRR